MLYSKPFQYSVSTKKIPFQANEITEYILISDELMARSHRATIIKSVFWCSTWTSNAFAGRYLETNSGNCSSQTDQVTHVTHNAQVLRMNSSTSPRIKQSGIYSHFEINSPENIRLKDICRRKFYFADCSCSMNAILAGYL